MLNHPNILTIYDIGDYEGSSYVVSELLEGETLRQRQKGTALPPRKSTEYALQIAEGLAAAHEKRIVHRDLKPENIFITKEGRVKILDFGLAKLTHDTEEGSNVTSLSTETGAGVVLGTVSYMSPEQVRGLSADPRSDIFAFGAVLYEMLSARTAFRRETAVETMNAILNEDPPEFSGTGHDVPPALEKIIRYCLEKNPQERFQSARDLALALSAISGSTEKQTALPPPRAGIRTLRIVAVAVLVITAVIAAFFIGHKRGATGLTKAAQPTGTAAPSFQRLTFRRGTIWSARFVPDTNTIVYTAGWEGKPPELFSTLPGSLESRSLGIKGLPVHSISSRSEMALLPIFGGTLSIVPVGGGAPREVLKNVGDVDWAPDGKNFAVIRQIPGGSRLEYPVGKVLHEGSPRFLRISPDGNYVAFQQFEREGIRQGSVYVVDRMGRKKRLSTGWLSLAFGMVWLATKEILFRGTDEKGDGIYAVNLEGKLRLLARMPPGTIRALLDISKDGKVLLTRGSWNNGMIGLLSGDKLERNLSWLDSPEAVDLSVDGKTLLFNEQGWEFGHKFGIYLWKSEASEPVRLGEGQAIGLSPDGESVLVRTSESQLAHRCRRIKTDSKQWKVQLQSCRLVPGWKTDPL